MSLHFKYHHQIDNHNNCRHSPISLEEIWGTKHWPDRIFSFVLAVSEVNARKAVEYFQNDGKSISQLEFHRKLAMELLNNTMDGISNEIVCPSGRRKRSRMDIHELLKIPVSRGKWNGMVWPQVKTDYLQQSFMCGKHVRTYCRCNKSVNLCVDFYADHISGS